VTVAISFLIFSPVIFKCIYVTETVNYFEYLCSSSEVAAEV
jgi:hypothetical protein